MYSSTYVLLDICVFTMQYYPQIEGMETDRTTTTTTTTTNNNNNSDHNSTSSIDTNNHATATYRVYRQETGCLH